MTPSYTSLIAPPAQRTLVRNLRYRPKGRLVGQRIDRRTRWGNPFYLRNETQRMHVIRSYERHLARAIVSGSVRRTDLAKLAGSHLWCWCAPRACHGDVLAAVAEAAASTAKEWNEAIAMAKALATMKQA